MPDRILADISSPLEGVDRAASDGGFPSSPYGSVETFVASPGEERRTWRRHLVSSGCVRHVETAVLDPIDEPRAPRRAANDDRETIGQILQALQKGRPARSVYTLATLFTGVWIAGCVLLTFSFLSSLQAAIGQSGGVLVLETDSRFLSSGTALQQQTAAFSSATLSGNYGMNLTGASSGGELDSIAEFNADGASRLSGIIDLNNTGVITFGQPLTGTFTVGSNGRTTSTLQTPLGTQNLAIYLVNGNRALFIELDSTLVAVGDIRHQ